MQMAALAHGCLLLLVVQLCWVGTITCASGSMYNRFLDYDSDIVASAPEPSQPYDGVSAPEPSQPLFPEPSQPVAPQQSDLPEASQPDGASGTSGAAQPNGGSETSVAAQPNGVAGIPGAAQPTGAPGTSGAVQPNGAPGDSGTAQLNGAPGTSGAAQPNGAPIDSGTAQLIGAPGTSGAAQPNGAIGTSGAAQPNGAPRTSQLNDNNFVAPGPSQPNTGNSETRSLSPTKASSSPDEASPSPGEESPSPEEASPSPPASASNTSKTVSKSTSVPAVQAVTTFSGFSTPSDFGDAAKANFINTIKASLSSYNVDVTIDSVSAGSIVVTSTTTFLDGSQTGANAFASAIGSSTAASALFPAATYGTVTSTAKVQQVANTNKSNGLSRHWSAVVILISSVGILIMS